MMSDPVTPINTQGEEWVSVAEASRRLGLDGRQVRRFMDRLDAADIATDSQRTHKGQPITIVRWEALKGVAKTLNGSQSARDSPADDSGQTAYPADDVRDAQETASGQSAVDLLRRAEVAEARAELLEASLLRETAALEIERDAHRRAELLHLNTQGELQQLRERARELEAMNGKLIAALPVVSVVADDAGNAPSERAGSPDTNGKPESDEVPGVTAQEVKTARQWWKFWE